jgi:hypothetical protein
MITLDLLFSNFDKSFKSYGVFTTSKEGSKQQKIKFKFKLWNLNTKSDKKHFAFESESIIFEIFTPLTILVCG